MSCRPDVDHPVVSKEVILADLLEVLQSLNVDDLQVVYEELLENLCSEESSEEESISL